MRKRNRYRLRTKVALRPRQRQRRNRVFAAVLSVAMIGAAAAATLRHAAKDVGNPFVYLRNSVSPALMTVEISSSSELARKAAEEFLASRGRLSPAAQAAALKDGLPFIKSVALRRDFLHRRAVLELSLRSVSAAATLKGRAAGFLSDDGVVFEAPEGLYNVPALSVEAAGADEPALKLAAKIARAAATPDALPSPLQGLRWVSAQEGWELKLEDGTAVLWGDGRWTSDKLSRLREILADAKTQPGTPARFVADLRYFEDGRVLLRPAAPSRTLSTR
jgi:hypothetical protein